MNSSGSGGTRPFIYTWSNSSSTNLSNDSTLSNVSSGTYYIALTDAHGCNTVDMVILYDPIEIELTIEDTISDYLGQITLDVTGGSPPYTYDWSNNATESELVDLPGGLYIVTVSDGFQCEVVDSVEIVIPLLIPTMFTPNGDGYNDNWEITNISDYSNVNIEIYNRWGDLVYSYDDSGAQYAGEPWKGDSNGNGNILPMGGYVYIITLEGIDEPYNGVVTIKL